MKSTDKSINELGIFLSVGPQCLAVESIEKWQVSLH